MADIRERELFAARRQQFFELGSRIVPAGVSGFLGEPCLIEASLDEQCVEQRTDRISFRRRRTLPVELRG
jgi:hypothetical protein